MKIFAQFEDVGSEYFCLAPVKISLTPFKEDCFYIDIEPNKVYNSCQFEGAEENFDWKPFKRNRK